MPKIDRAYKNYLLSNKNFRGNESKGDILWLFDFSTK